MNMKGLKLIPKSLIIFFSWDTVFLKWTRTFEKLWTIIVTAFWAVDESLVFQVSSNLICSTLLQVTSLFCFCLFLIWKRRKLRLTREEISQNLRVVSWQNMDLNLHSSDPRWPSWLNVPSMKENSFFKFINKDACKPLF